MTSIVPRQIDDAFAVQDLMRSIQTIKDSNILIFHTVAEMKQQMTNGSCRLVTNTNTVDYFYSAGDFTDRIDDVNFLQLDKIGAGTGALVRQNARNLTFIGANGKARSLEDKNREIASVADYGAMGDGITNDTKAFNAAIATGKKVFVPYTPFGYVVNKIDVVDNIHIYGEKSGMASAPFLIVASDNGSAFYNNSSGNVFHCVFENLACGAAPGVKGASFYSQRDLTKYSAYFTFREIETYKSLKISYVGLFIFALWDRIRDGYLGQSIDNEHSGIIALAQSYSQTNQQNINRVKDSMFFGTFGPGAAVVGSYGVLWTFENVDFEALKTPAILSYNVFKIKFSNCWFEHIDAICIIDLRNYPNINAASSATIDHCNFVFNARVDYVVSVESPGTVSVRDSMFNLVTAGTKLCNNSDAILDNSGNIVGGGDGQFDLMAGMHHDFCRAGRKMLNGAVDNLIKDMTIQNKGGVTADKGFLSGTNLVVGTDFVTVAKSQTGLGAVVRLSGYVPSGPFQGRQFSYCIDFQGADTKNVYPPREIDGLVVTFTVIGNELRMRVDKESLIVFTSIIH